MSRMIDWTSLFPAMAEGFCVQKFKKNLSGVTQGPQFKIFFHRV